MVPLSSKLVSWILPEKRNAVINSIDNIISGLNNFRDNTHPIIDNFYFNCIYETFANSRPKNNAFYSVTLHENISYPLQKINLVIHDTHEISEYLNFLAHKKDYLLEEQLRNLDNIYFYVSLLDTTSRIAKNIYTLEDSPDYNKNLHAANLFAYKLILSVEFSYSINMWNSFLQELDFNDTNIKRVTHLINEEKKLYLHSYLKEKEEYFDKFVSSKNLYNKMNNQLPQKSGKKELRKI